MLKFVFISCYCLYCVSSCLELEIQITFRKEKTIFKLDDHYSIIAIQCYYCGCYLD